MVPDFLFMHNQRGFVGVGTLIAILIGLAVLVVGAYYVLQQQAPTQTVIENFDNVQTLPTTNNQAQQLVKNKPTTREPASNPPSPQKSTVLPAVQIKSSWDCNPVSPSSDLNLNVFYKKVCVVQGIPIVSSETVPDRALIQAAVIMKGMLDARPDIVQRLVIHKMKVAILGANEVTTMLPEYAFLKNDTQTDWDLRARGLGATIAVPLASGAEENLLCYSSDVYKRESIFLHEFAHSIKDLGVIFLDPSFNEKLEATYQSALSNGLWKNTYAAANREEYWAEGAQDYFDANASTEPADGIHNLIHTREQLKTYDPLLYELVAKVFPTEWRYQCPR